MKITSIIENTSATGLPVEHGLSLYIQLDDGRNILFDMGQRRLFAENAERLGLSIADVDIAAISHGHYDHGGGLRAFLELNTKAKVYIHKDAFLPHYSLRENGLAYIGLDKDLKDNPRLEICESQRKIDESMILFADVHGDCCSPLGNQLLYEASSESIQEKHSLNGSTSPKGLTKSSPLGELEVAMVGSRTLDHFTHEQNLIIKEGDNTILFAGCAHNGIVNILRKAEQVIGKSPTHVLAGMHLVKSGLNEEDEKAFIASLAQELMSYKETMFYTMHCTGIEQYQKLKSLMGNQIEYLSCGDSVMLSL